MYEFILKTAMYSMRAPVCKDVLTDTNLLRSPVLENAVRVDYVGPIYDCSHDSGDID